MGCGNYIIFHKKEKALKGQALVQITKRCDNRKITKPLTLNKLYQELRKKTQGTEHNLQSRKKGIDHLSTLQFIKLVNRRFKKKKKKSKQLDVEFFTS